MTPQEAAAAWLEVMERFAVTMMIMMVMMMMARYPDRTLVSPATGHMDTEWFDEFWAECELLGCRFTSIYIYIRYNYLDIVNSECQTKMDCLFIVLYLRCRFDYLATHWYSKTQNATETISALREYSERYGGLRIWFTEFAVRQVQPSFSALMTTLLP